jgi:hypothetical protein
MRINRQDAKIARNLNPEKLAREHGKPTLWEPPGDLGVLAVGFTSKLSKSRMLPYQQRALAILRLIEPHHQHAAEVTTRIEGGQIEKSITLRLCDSGDGLQIGADAERAILQ